MADKKISQLTALSAANLAPSTDVLAIVDTSATETKKIVAQDLVNGVLNVASAVGIGTSSPTFSAGGGLHISNATAANLRLQDTTTNVYTNIWQADNGSTSSFLVDIDPNNVGSGGCPLVINTAGSMKVTLSSSGNLGLGVTPSLWNSDYKALNIGSKGIVYGRVGSQETAIGANWYRTTAAAFVYASNGFATFYAQDSGNHTWHIAPNNTSGAGATASFTQAMTLDADGDLGIGTTTPSYKVDIVGGNIWRGTSSSTSAALYISAGQPFLGTTTNHAFSFITNDTERARITSGGKFLLNATSTVASGDEICGMIGTNGLSVKCTGGSGSFAAAIWNDATSGDNTLAVFYTETGGTQRGSITYNRGAGQVAYNVTSDARLKENIADAVDAGSKIDALKVRQFDWKETGNHVDYGFVAQELDAIAPQAVSKPEDEEAMWSVDYSKLVPMLVKEIQSLRSRVAALEAK